MSSYPTREQIDTLQQEAAQAGDQATVDLCDQATGAYWPTPSPAEQQHALDRLVEILDEARSAAGGR